MLLNQPWTKTKLTIMPFFICKFNKLEGLTATSNSLKQSKKVLVKKLLSFKSHIINLPETPGDVLVSLQNKLSSYK